MKRWLSVAVALAASACAAASGAAPSKAPPQTPPDVATAGCPVAEPLAPPRTMILFRNDGCVPPSTLLAFRCSPDDPTIIETGAGTETLQRFAGGRFAVPVSTLPTDAVPVGEGAEMQVYVVPDDPSMLYVGQGDTVTRWLRLPQRQLLAPPTAFVIGDSIADGAAPYIEQALPDWTIGFDAVIGRSTNTALTAAAEQGAIRPDVVVVELGTNDADPVAFGENAATILDALRPVPLVIWQTAHGPLTNIPEIDRRIREFVARYPNTVIADWDAFVTADELSSDGVHPAAGHEDLMALLIAPILEKWFDTASGIGGTACAGQVEAAAGVG
jgi:hypothetical protein